MDSSPVAAELIVRKGRQQGVRRTLKSPVTIIGSTKGCDVRLDVDSVRPIHCMIAIGPDGPCLRSWGADDTFVNDAPHITRQLRDGDILRVGPFEFAIHCPQPAVVTEPIPLPIKEPKPAAEAPAEVSAPTEARLHELHQQLGEARAQFRREKTEHEADAGRQIRDLAEARESLETREAEVVRDRTRLLTLRQRFIKRWKKHWSLQRKRFEEQVVQLENDRACLEEDRESLDSAVVEFRQREEVESRRIQYGWEQLRLAERTIRDRQRKWQSELEQRQRIVSETAARLQKEREALQTERKQFEHHSADLRIEADGLESRIVNLRAVLLQLEEQRAKTRVEALPHSDSSSTVALPEDIERQRLALQRLAEELADQRLALHEQVTRLAVAREQWRVEETRLMDEMAGLADQLHRREELVVESEKATALTADHLEYERAELKQLRERLEAWQTVQRTIELDWRSELGRRDLEVKQRARQLDRRQQALKELCHRWRKRRHEEVSLLRTEHRRSERERQALASRETELEHRESALDQQKRDLAAQALIVEKARGELLENDEKPLLTARRLERLGRHVRHALAKAEAAIERKRSMLQSERQHLDELFSRVSQRIETAAIDQREAGIKVNEVERREFVATGREAALAEQLSSWSQQLVLFERERGNLRDEIDRLAGLFFNTDQQESVPLARAA